MAANYTDTGPLASPLLAAPPMIQPACSGDAGRSFSSPSRGLLPPRTPRDRTAARAALRKCIIRVIAKRRADRGTDAGRPSIAAAKEYMRFFLPKTPDGKLLPLRCSEAEFTVHCGSGVALYMHFVKMTGYMFVAASVIVLPQFYANLSGHELALEWPLDSPDCTFAPGVMGLVSKLLSCIAYIFYGQTLGNVSFNTSHGWIHLVTELLLCMMFCVYVYLIYRYNNEVLSKLEDTSVRASDFAVMVSKLPASGVTPRAIKAHFAFFGPVTSVALSTDNHELLDGLERHRHLKANWRRWAPQAPNRSRTRARRPLTSGRPLHDGPL